MTDSDDTRPPRKIGLSKTVLYWVCCALGLVLLMVAIGALGHVIYGGGMPFHRVWALLFVAVGAVLVAWSVRNPFALWRSRFRPENPELERLREEVDGEDAASFVPEFLGVGFVVGGLVYMATARMEVMLGVWIVAVIILWILRRLAPPVDDP